MIVYAQIDEQDYCIGVSELSGEVDSEDMIQINSYDSSYLSRKYDRKNKVWTDEYAEVEEVEKGLSTVQLLGQQLSDLEIQQLEYNLKATQEREFLGQQLSDFETSILERGI